MAVELINDHVLFPHRANWATDPEWSRAWQTKLSSGITGAEVRSALRSTPRVTLRFVPSIRNLQEQTQLNDRIRAALKCGKACCPYWGRASVLALDCGLAAATLQATPWPWAEGDWIFFLDSATRDYCVRQVTAVAGAALTLDDVVNRTYHAGMQVWPMLFGRLREDTLALETSHRGNFAIAITENAAPAAVVGDYNPPDPEEDLAIPDMEIGDSFIVR